MNERGGKQRMKRDEKTACGALKVKRGEERRWRKREVRNW